MPGQKKWTKRVSKKRVSCIVRTCTTKVVYAPISRAEFRQWIIFFVYIAVSLLCLKIDTLFSPIETREGEKKEKKKEVNIDFVELLNPPAPPPPEEENIETVKGEEEGKEEWRKLALN